MSENIVKRDEKGRLLPGALLNPGGRSIRTEAEREYLAILHDKLNPERVGEAIDYIMREGSPKVIVQMLGLTLPYLLGGKPPTKHIRVSTKFEDMLSALGSNRIVTIDGEVESAE